MPASTFILINEAKDPRLTPEVLAAGAAAIQKHNNEHFAPRWNQLPSKITVANDEVGVDDYDHATRFVKATPEAPGAIAYHTKDAKGRPVLVIGLDALDAEGENFFDALWIAVSHEVWETCADQYVDDYVDMPDGSGNQTPREVSDWVQGDAIVTDDGHVLADWTTPEFFNADTDSTDLDFLGLVKKPFEVRPGGYAEIRKPDGTTTMIFGEKVSEKTKAHKLAALAGGYSRTTA